MTISSYHFFSLMVLFELGTTVIFGFGTDSGRDAWLSALLSSLLGGILIAGYVTISKLNSFGSLVGVFTKLFGKWLGTPIAWLYPIFFIYTAARIICDLRFLVPLTLLPKTPAWFFIGMLILLFLYVLYAGIEVLFRITGVLLPILIIFIIFETIVLLASGSLHSDYLRPMLADGFGKVGNSLWPVGVTTTYGECFVMFVFYCLLNKKGNLGRVSVGAALFAGLLVVLFDVLAITALGENLFQKMIFPAYTILKLASVEDFLENLEVLGAMYFMCSAFIKVAVYLFAAVFCMRELTHASNDHPAIWITVLLAFFISMTMANNLSEHLQVWLGSLANFVVVPMYVVLPGIILVLSLLGKMKTRSALP
ncbi:spore germination protein [Paenibacillus sp. HWE-109]|uniref:GerAB/ArcD/ProY family transporter n=1 Tax=Paenibacillus sp. HWE-109 TaxID=1306526 RepID=UPI001EDDCDCC|nr:GerAB/ArcD/ProY family transporter [Paenibacillus sp. HWE-109]UKS24499.1 spore germination protein [Paenibacillus sp. HWE-109]